MRAMPLEIIAELHPQHGGDLGILREMIRQAKLNGADVAKVQLYDAVALLGSADWSYLQLSRETTAQLKGWCDEDEIEFMASVFDHERLGWCEELGVRRYKIASRTVTGDVELCRSILATGKPAIVSLGNWNRPGKPFGEDEPVKYLYCKAKYPALYTDLADFPDDFPAAGLAGYSDHTIGIEVALLSIGRGAAVVEKHLTLDKTRGRPTEKGHAGSMTPQELNTLRRIGGLLYRARRAIHASRP
jgi:sialic acid synthase SpsE